MPEGVPRLTAVGVNYRILGSAALAAIACGLFIGLGPATYLTTPNLAGALRDRPPAAAAPLQTAFIVGEVAVAVVLVVGSGLFVASFIRLMRVDLGFDHRGVAAIPCPRIDLSNEQARNETHFRAEALLTAGIERLRAMRVC